MASDYTFIWAGRHFQGAASDEVLLSDFDGTAGWRAKAIAANDTYAVAVGASQVATTTKPNVTVIAGRVSGTTVKIDTSGGLHFETSWTRTAQTNAIPLLIGAAYAAGVPAQFASMEFIAAAIWDRALTDSQIAQASQELLGIPHTDQIDPHSDYPPLVAGSLPASLPANAREGTIAVLADNTVAIRTRTGGWKLLATSALPGSPP